MAMKMVTLGYAEAGQIIARDLTNCSGGVLCSKGTILTERLIERLRKAQVAGVYVERSLTREEAEARKARLDQLRARFKGVEDPIMLQLKVIMERRLGGEEEVE
ncbi:MAG: hypothetical protein ACLFU6_01140 [Candidatus Hydrogenedentota bacterium]